MDYNKYIFYLFIINCSFIEYHVIIQQNKKDIYAYDAFSYWNNYRYSTNYRID
jgi:hypothetical protein